MKDFQLVSDFEPKGDQPKAIEELVQSIESGVNDQVLLGATGTGKTFTIAHTIARLNRPALILAPNKTLAAQLYNEMKELFPHNAVEYFVSYYDYYQPEAYLPHSDTFIEKDSSINDDIDKLRHAATYSLLMRRDVIIIASVSCIYGLGSPEYYLNMSIPIEVGQKISLEKLLRKLVDVQYERNDVDFHRGTFRVRGDVLEIIPAYEREQALRIEFFGDEIDTIYETDYLTGTKKASLEKTLIFPASHYVSDKDNIQRAMSDIRDELQVRLATFQSENKLVEAQRLEQRTQFDLESMEEIGFCMGIENYSRHLDGRSAGSSPATLIDYFPKDFLLFVDESHITIPQIGGMFNGDRSRKTTLVNFGFRLPSALDNRPLSFDEFLERIGQSVFVSATPGNWELERSSGLIVSQIIRPTGLLDPIVSIRPTEGQMDDLLHQCNIRAERNERVLVTTLTKRMAEDLSEYFTEMGMRTRYLHSDIDTLGRMAIIEDLRNGLFDVLIGINLLREGLDIPEVALVAILDADKEGFLRSARSLIQTFGRAARNVHGEVYLYADKITRSMEQAMEETSRRREVQDLYNKEHGIEPQTIIKKTQQALKNAVEKYLDPEDKKVNPIIGMTKKEIEKQIKVYEKDMRKKAQDLDFEEAARLRDEVAKLRMHYLQI